MWNDLTQSCGIKACVQAGSELLWRRQQAVNSHPGAFPRNFCAHITLPTPHLQHCRSEAAMVTGPAFPECFSVVSFWLFAHRSFAGLSIYPFLPARFVPELEVQFVTLQFSLWKWFLTRALQKCVLASVLLEKLTWKHAFFPASEV